MQIIKYKGIKILVGLFVGFFLSLNVSAQKIALKTNALEWATATSNISAEFAFGKKMSGELSVLYNPFTFSGNKKISGIAFQPEIKYWFCIPFYKHYIGIHPFFSDYNVGWTKYRYQGQLYGCGLSYGYQMILSKRLNLEFTLGVGYARMDHDRYERYRCGLFLDSLTGNYFGLTKLGISIVYFIK